ncbi:hypothetical protein CHRY9390_02435 [Chryseobacterium aquaeductus]|uniref:HTH psq-type domain-containing protein n=1 Tax=Chryseobacterium aquaeductus TaxID=2675056 RepID=A0A9N8QR67_9FLAO|nr:transposase [Chryseobacterium aquaeductus]CAA7331721.1 hypothetical protein CHRY9390_02435 [Chryseobacterium potabilaquae]CAD7811908.1 hypothetical protein CHRY9390_02435 [Chryseobacterium aquaeductus]
MKEIHIGKIILQKVQERDIQMTRICNFLHCNVNDVMEMFEQESINTHTLLRWSKLLEFDFFRIYTSHLILFSPCKTNDFTKKRKNTLLEFRKNLYTQEVKDFILEKINNNEMSKNEVMSKYNIPRTTLYTWIKKSVME